MYVYKKKDCLSKGGDISIVKCRTIAPETAHMHEFVEIVYILSGRGTQRIDNTDYEVSGGDLLFINCGQVHSFESAKGSELVYYNLLINPELISTSIVNNNNFFDIMLLTAFEDIRKISSPKQFVSFAGNEKIRIESILSEMENEYNGSMIKSEFVLIGYVTVILAYISRKVFGAGEESDINVMGDILKYIEEHISEKLSLEELSKKSFYSPKYFSRLFKSSCGISITEYIQRERIKLGARLLCETNYTVDEIAHMVGYSTSVHFYRYFAKYKGMTPNRYRTGNG